MSKAVVRNEHLKCTIYDTEASQDFLTFNLIKDIIRLIQPHNMQIERGFNITGDVLTKKRSTLGHNIYRSVKIIKRDFPSIEDIPDTLTLNWD